MSDMINHPDHYMSESGLEVIDVIDAFTENLEGREAIYTANIIKYICRWKEKNGLEDLKKARWYLDRLIEFVEEDKKNVNDDPLKVLWNEIIGGIFDDAVTEILINNDKKESK